MTRWFRSHWAEEDTWFYFEVDDDGWVTRQFELQGPLEKPIAAASLTEWEAAQQARTLANYEAIFGATAVVPVHEWDTPIRRTSPSESSRPCGAQHGPPAR